MNCSEKKQIKLTEPQDPKVKANYISGYRQKRKTQNTEREQSVSVTVRIHLSTFTFVLRVFINCCDFMLANRVLIEHSDSNYVFYCCYIMI